MTLVDGPNCLTKMEALVVQRCHHGLDAMSKSDAAKEMGITIQTLNEHLRNAEMKAPNLFPILTPKQAEILHLYNVEGWSVAMISQVKEISEATVRGYLRRLRSKGALNDNRPKRPISFSENTMSHRVVRKW